MAEYIEFASRFAFLNHRHSPPIDVYIKNKEKYPYSSYFLMDDYVTPFSLGKKDINTIDRNHKRKQQETQSPTKKRIRPIATATATTSASASTSVTATGDPNNLQRLIQLQDTLDYLQDEWATIDIILQSLKTVFTIHPSRMETEDYLDNIDRELSIAYDDLMAQIRSLERNLRKVDLKIKAYGFA
ncbi:hypothetical protein BCR42DRAFT_418425 [Absidia repens]|uniref:Uncharacterized protein n=1 Tax=Absidia repens TaxID=90262 RepID=A0A1X2IBL6_9FUNG|nr:hypothetical protein BCR42DRAFT_418425 [Absidia repens]